MGRAPCCDKANVKKGPWSPEEDAKLKSYIDNHGTGGNWIALPHKIGLKRCGKSCRLRWLNYLRPNIKHGGFTQDEDNLICSLYVSIGSRWSIIAAQLPGRTDNDIKNYWNTRLKKKLLGSKAPKPVGHSSHDPASNHVQLMMTVPHHQFPNSAHCFEAFDDQSVSWGQHEQLGPLLGCESAAAAGYMVSEGDHNMFPGGFEEAVYQMPHDYNSGGVDGGAFSAADTVRFGAITSENANWPGDMINPNYVADTYPGVDFDDSRCDDRKMTQDCWMTSLLMLDEPRLLGHSR